MSMSNATENQTLKMHLQGTDPSYRAGATQYLALVTDGGGAVSEAAPIANECTYTGYARVAVGGHAVAALDDTTGRATGAAIATGAGAQTLDDVTGTAAGAVSNVVTLRQRQGRRDDLDLLVSGWR